MQSFVERCHVGTLSGVPTWWPETNQNICYQVLLRKQCEFIPQGTHEHQRNTILNTFHFNASNINSRTIPQVSVFLSQLKSLFPFFFSRPHSQGIKKKSSHCWQQSYLLWLTTLMCFHVLLLFWLAVNTSLTFTSKPQRWQPLTMHLIFSKASSRSSWVDIYIYHDAKRQ